jgi:hypothetical protein
MGSPAVCGFSNLPIPSGTPIVLCWVKRAPWHNRIIRPFDAYSPSTPIVRAQYDEDGWFEMEDDQAQILRDQFAILTQDAVLGEEEELEEFDPTSVNTYSIEAKYESKSYLPYMIRADIWEFMGTVGYSDNWDPATRKSGWITVDQEIASERRRALELTKTYLANPYRPDGGTLQRMFHFGEGERCEIVQTVIRRVFGDNLIKTAEDPTVTAEGLVAGLEPLFDIAKLRHALVLSRRAIFPLDQIGEQRFEGRNVIAVAEMIRAIVEAEREDEE